MYIRILFSHFILVSPVIGIDSNCSPHSTSSCSCSCSLCSCSSSCSCSYQSDYDCTFTCQLDNCSIDTVCEVTVTDNSSGMTIQKSNDNVVHKDLCMLIFRI